MYRSSALFDVVNALSLAARVTNAALVCANDDVPHAGNADPISLATLKAARGVGDWSVVERVAVSA